jgi:hypothetical protein
MKPEEERKALEIVKRLISKPVNLNLLFNVSSILEINNLRSIINIDCSDHQIIDALSKLNKDSNVKLSDLISAVKIKVKSDEKANESNLWSIVVPFEAPINRRTLTINGCVIKLSSYSSLKKYRNKEYSMSARESLYPIRIEKQSHKFLILTSKGANINVAWKKVEPQFKTLKGIYDLCISYNSWTLLNSNKQSRTRIPHPKYVYGLSDSGVATYIEFITNDCQKKHDPLKTNQILIFNQIIKFLKQDPALDSIEFFLSDLFRLYSEAMDENLFSNSYLRFWQLCEKISLSEPRGSFNELKNKIQYFLNEAYPTDITSYFESLIRKRNDLVHRGIDNIEIADISLLKNFSEKMILWLYNNRKIIKSTKHLESYYNSVNKNNIDLLISSKMMIKILRQRKKINKNGL